MTLYARWISKPALWTDLDEPASWDNDDFPFPALQELADGREKGLSCFEVRTKRDSKVRRVAAALSLMRGDGLINNMQFRFIPPSVLNQLHLKIRKTPGKTVDEEVNKTHVEITGLNGPTAVALARALRGRLFIVDEEAIFKEIIVGLKNGYLKFADINKDKLTKKIAQLYCNGLQKRNRAYRGRKQS